jgi:Cu/Ag efflux protein CusF
VRIPIVTLAVTLALLAALAAGCGAEPAPDGRHTVRGEIVKLPDPPGTAIYVRHEAIPDFRDAAGKRVGMSSMTMPFALAPGVELGDLAAGDRIEVDLEVRWDGAGEPLRVTRVARLPAGTRLEFDPAPRPDAQPAGSTPR